MISLVIPCLNHYKTTVDCLRYLNKFTDFKDVELILIDDGSNDETQFIGKAGIKFLIPSIPYSRIKIIRHKITQGFAYSVNQGINESQFGSFIGIFNNDMLVGPRWLEPLIEALKKDDELGMITSTLVEPDQMKVKDFLPYVETAQKHGVGIAYWEKGGPWIFKREVFSEVGLFDEQFKYCQYEDIDFIIRMCLKKFKVARLLGSFVYHFSSLTQKGELKKRIGTSYVQDNREKFIKKWGTADIDFQAVFERKGIWEKV